MSLFDDAADTLFEDENLACDALYRAAGQGSGVPVRLMFATPRREQPFGQTGAIVNDIAGSVRYSEVSEPKRGDTFEIAVPSRIAGTYRVEKVETDSKRIAAILAFSKQ